MTHPLVVAADRYAERLHPAPRLRRAHAVSKLIAAYVARPEVVAAAALQGVARYCGFGELRARFGEPTARLLAEVEPRPGCGSPGQREKALKTRRLRRLSPEAQSICVATLIQRTTRLLNQPVTLARVGLAQTCAELAALDQAHPVLQSIAHKLCSAALRRLCGVHGTCAARTGNDSASK